MGPSTVFFIFAGVLTLISIIMAYQATKRLRLAKICELAVEIEPSDAGHDLGRSIRVAGEAAAVGDGALTAPISQGECVYWKYEVRQRVRRHGETRTRTIADGASQRIFAIRDSAGQILIDPKTVQIRDIKRSATHTILPFSMQAHVNPAP